MSREARGKGLLVYPVFFAKKAEVIEKNRDGVSRFVLCTKTTKECADDFKQRNEVCTFCVINSEVFGVLCGKAVGTEALGR